MWVIYSAKDICSHAKSVLLSKTARQTRPFASALLRCSWWSHRLLLPTSGGAIGCSWLLPVELRVQSSELPNSLGRKPWIRPNAPMRDSELTAPGSSPGHCSQPVSAGYPITCTCAVLGYQHYFFCLWMVSVDLVLQ